MIAAIRAWGGRLARQNSTGFRAAFLCAAILASAFLTPALLCAQSWTCASRTEQSDCFGREKKAANACCTEVDRTSPDEALTARIGLDIEFAFLLPQPLVLELPKALDQVRGTPELLVRSYSNAPPPERPSRAPPALLV